MPRIPITVMGYRCERCSHEWIPKDAEVEPAVCPKCKSPYWNRPRKTAPMLTYEEFRDKIELTLAPTPNWIEYKNPGEYKEMKRKEFEDALKLMRDAHAEAERKSGVQ